MGGKAQAPKAPKYKELAKTQAEIALKQDARADAMFEWAQEQYALDREQNQKFIDQAYDINQRNAEWAEQDRIRYQEQYQPLEDDLIREAKEYASPERIEMEMGRAQADVATQSEAARNAALQQLESFGIDPTSTRYAALDAGTRVAEAAAKAGAGNMARDKTEAMGRAMRSEAINIGRGYPGQIAGTYNTALAAGNSGANTGLATTASGANTMGTPTQWSGLSNQGLAGAGNTLTSGYQAQVAGFNAQQQASSGLGSLLGVGAGLGMRMFGFEEGGEVPDEPEEGGPVDPALSPSQGAAVDDVSARLNAGEFVIPREVVEFKGEEFFHKLIAQTKQARERAIGESGAKPEMRQAIPGPPRFVSRRAA